MGMSENLEVKDFETLVADTLNYIVNSDVGITNTATGSVTRTLVEAILSNVDSTNYYIQYIYDAMGIDDATGEDLDRLISILGVVREKATKSSAIVTFSTGDEPYPYDISIPYGYEISTRQLSDGTVVVYTVAEEDVVLTAGETEIDVLVEAEEAGHQYLPAGSLCVMGSSIIGIQSAVNKNEVNNGTDEEDDDTLRARTKEYVQAYGKCTDTAIKVAVEKIDGVNNCRIVDLYKGVGTTGAIVATDILPAPEPLKAEIEKVIADTKASGIKVFVVYPSIKYIDIDISVTVDGMDDTIIQAISDYANSLSVGQTFVIRQMERKILNALDKNNVNNDDIDITTNSPSSNVECESDEEIIKVSKIKINGEIHDV